MKSRMLLLTCLVTLAGLSTYSVLVGPGRVDTVREVVREAGQGTGRQVALESNVRVVSYDADSLLLAQGRARIRAEIPAALKSRWEQERETVAPGEYISLRGRVIAGPAIEVHDYHLHRRRSFKIWLSLAALVTLIGIIFLERRWERANA